MGARAKQELSGRRGGRHCARLPNLSGAFALAPPGRPVYLKALISKAREKMTANPERLSHLDALEAEAQSLSEPPTIGEIAIGCALGYLDFAVSNTNLLRSLFEHRMEGDRPFPQDILDMVMEAFALIYSPLFRLFPDRDPAELALIARTMFSATHGIVSLGLEDRMVAVPQDQLKEQLTQFVEAQLLGLGASAT